MIASPSTSYRLDDLRRLATVLISNLGVSPARASALATHLLWFDAAAASSHGISTLPTWLDRLEKKEIDPHARGRAMLEHAGTAVFDAQNGLAPLALETAAGIASEKARDVGIGVVRVRNIGPTGPSAPVADGLAIGPIVAMIAGTPASLTMAVPTSTGIPAIYDSELAREAGQSASPPERWWQAFSPWISTMAGGDGWIILALSIPALESLSTFHERASNVSGSTLEESGRWSPSRLEAHRRQAREQGVALDPLAEAGLKEWAGRWNVAWPSELGG